MNDTDRYDAPAEHAAVERAAWGLPPKVRDADLLRGVAAQTDGRHQAERTPMTVQTRLDTLPVAVQAIAARLRHDFCDGACQAYVGWGIRDGFRQVEWVLVNLDDGADSSAVEDLVYANLDVDAAEDVTSSTLTCNTLPTQVAIAIVVGYFHAYDLAVTG